MYAHYIEPEAKRVAAAGHDTVRRMRTAVLIGDPKMADRTLTEGNNIDRAIAMLLFRHKAGKNTFGALAYLSTLVESYGPEYEHFDPTSRYQDESEHVIWRAAYFAERLHKQLVLGRCLLSDDRGAETYSLDDIEAKILADPHWAVSFSTDPIIAHMISLGLKQAKRARPCVIPLAVSIDGQQVVIPSWAPVDCVPFVECETEKNTTFNAIAGAFAVDLAQAS